MSRKRDTNWSRDEIKVLLDSITEITKTSSNNGKRTNSKEVFEFAAKKMGEKGYPSRADIDRCRTKWKKLKEEYSNTCKARAGDTRYKEAPGLQPFYDRMGELINGKFDNISPHSTIVRKTSTMPPRSQAGRNLSRIQTNGAASTDNSDTSSTIVTKATTASSDYNNSLSSSTTSLAPSGHLHQLTPTKEVVVEHNQRQEQQQQLQQPQSQAITTNEEMNIPNVIYTSYNSNGITPNATASSSSNMIADISYRVSNGCRQITIFGDHDVDIKFRGDCVTINKIDVDFQAHEI